MRIGITGADSVGKTTLINELARQLILQAQRVTITSAGDVARRCPFPLVTAQTIESSEWILEAISRTEAEAAAQSDVLLCDRTVLDIWIFAKIGQQGIQAEKSRFRSFTEKIAAALKDYQVIFVCTADPAQPVNYQNLPDGSLETRKHFEEILIASLNRFREACEFSMLPYATTDRLETIRQRIART